MKTVKKKKIIKCFIIADWSKLYQFNLNFICFLVQRRSLVSERAKCLVVTIPSIKDWSISDTLFFCPLECQKPSVDLMGLHAHSQYWQIIIKFVINFFFFFCGTDFLQLSKCPGEHCQREMRSALTKRSPRPPKRLFQPSFPCIFSQNWKLSDSTVTCFLALSIIFIFMLNLQLLIIE